MISVARSVCLRPPGGGLGVWFRPGDELPSWAVDKLRAGNPKLLAGVDEEEPGAAGVQVTAPEPPHPEVDLSELEGLDPDELEQLATLTDDERAKLAELVSATADTEPAPKSRKRSTSN